MTNHCGGIIGHNAGYQFVGVSNWNHAQKPSVDSMLDRALAGAVAKLSWQSCGKENFMTT